MKNRFMHTASPLAIAASCLPGAAALAENDVAGDLITFNSNGAWSWFQDPRVIVDTNANKILVSSVADSSGTDGNSRGGQVDVVEYGLGTQAINRFVLGTPGGDDHNLASFYIRSDGRYVASWSAHNADNSNRYRISTNPGDATTWGATTTVNNGARTTYENLHYLPGDDNGNGRLYNFTRSINFDPTIQTSSDEGLTWAGTTKLLTQTTGSDRPYLRYASNGDKIHFIATEEHPRDFNNSIYHGYVKDGKLFASDGTQLDGNLFDNTAVGVGSLTTVFAADTVNQGDPMTRAWTVDLELDASGNPYAVFQARIDPGTLSGGQSSLDHRFFYARHDGTQWNVNALAEAGRDIYAASPNGSEDDYTGLVALDPNDPGVLYMSSDIDPRDNSGTDFYEIYKGVTDDGGASWDWSAITENSTVDNVRPIVPDWDEANTALLWMRGNYTTFTNYDTDIVGVVIPEPSTLGLVCIGGMLLCQRRGR
ncbi:MAG: BNR repeat-containing protein [Phycisphaeraceae bacterium]|nr:BNR repeat-containing protein [Phycisphaeraceae bacterium]